MYIKKEGHNMKRSTLFSLFVIGATFVFLSGLKVASVEAADYVGVQKCKMCHSSKALGGVQYKVWEKSRHAEALETLKQAGESNNPKCLKCHTTGYGEPAAAGADLANVQCEACHGPGSKYRSMKIMNKKAFKANRAAAHQKALDAGLVMPPTEEVCRKCHNEESPKFKGFDFAAYKEKIKHW
jgi:uncharacterized paraquat-inducible protein A